MTITPLIWVEHGNWRKAQRNGIKFFIFRAPHPVAGFGRNYALRIEFNSDGAWIRSEDILDDGQQPTICRDIAQKISDAISSAIADAVSEERKEAQDAVGRFLQVHNGRHTPLVSGAWESLLMEKLGLEKTDGVYPVFRVAPQAEARK